MLHLAVTGDFVGSVAYPDDAQERDKLITSTVIEGASMLFLDNIETGWSISNRDKALLKLVTDTRHTGTNRSGCRRPSPGRRISCSS